MSVENNAVIETQVTSVTSARKLAQPDQAEMRRAIKTLFQETFPEGQVEVRAFGKKGTPPTSACYHDEGELASKTNIAANHKAFSGVYWTLQVIDPAFKGKSVSDSNIIAFRWLPIDIDPERPANVSSTDTEKDSAYTVMINVRDYLASLGVITILADSGNGYHLLAKIDLPASDKALVQNILLHLSEKFSTNEANVDRVNYNPSRIFKAYGSVARKGPDTSERPHRVARILDVPESLPLVPLTTLESLAGLISSKAPKVPTGPEFATPLPSEELQAKIQEMDGFLSHVGIAHSPWMPYKTGFKTQLQACPFNPEHQGTDSFVSIPPSGAKAFKCSHDSCQGNDWKKFRKLVDPNNTFPWAGLAAINAAGLMTNDRGVALPILANAITGLMELSGVVAYNEFSMRSVIVSETPWQKVSGEWTDADDIRACEWLQRKKILVGTDVTSQAIQVVAQENSFHPVRQYLESLIWDGIPRIDKWLTSFLGVEPTVFTGAVGQRWLISGVARIFNPGCQADYVLLLEGPQGILKSSALRALGEPWFTDHISELGSKDAMQDLCGRWIIELGELTQVKRGDKERVKAFITSTADHYRPSYGRRTIDVPRQCIFAASTNDASPFVDETGNRRYWPVTCGVIDIQGLKAQRDQLWAEAVALYHQGAKHWLDTPELNALAKEQQDARYESGVWDDKILGWIENPEYSLGTGQTVVSDQALISTPERVLVTEILQHAIGKTIDRCNQGDKTAVARCLTHHGWKMKTTRIKGVGYRMYVRPGITPQPRPPKDAPYSF